jgi:hypothetical protein
VTVYYYSKLYNTSLPLVYLVESIKRSGLINKEFSSISQIYVLRLRYHVGEEKSISFVVTDLVLSVLRILRQDLGELVDSMEPVEPWDEG